MGERTRDAPSSPDPLNSFPPLRLHQSDGDDAVAAVSPSSRYSSCGGDSEYDRYCSANSAMGTPSMCSTITLYNDFPELDFGSARGFGIAGDDGNGLENFSLGGGRAEMSHVVDRRFGSQRNLRYGSSGLELYGDGGDELAMTMLDSSEVLGFNRTVESGQRNESKGVEGYVGIGRVCDDESDNENGYVGSGSVLYDGNECGSVGNNERCVLGNLDVKKSSVMVGGGGLSCEAGGVDQHDGFGVRSNLEVEERETEMEEDGGLSDCQYSEGEDSIYDYGSGGDSKNQSYLSRSIHYRKELEARNENPLLINSSVAFGSDDLDDFLLENESSGRVSVMSDLFRKRQEKKREVEEVPVNSGSVSSVGFAGVGQEEEGKAKQHMVIVDEKAEEIKDIGKPETVEEARDIPATRYEVQGADQLTNVRESSIHASTDFLNTVKSQVQGADALVSVTKADEVHLDPLAEEAARHFGPNAADSGGIEKGNQHINIEEAVATSDAQNVKNSQLDNSKLKFDHFSDSRVDQNSSSQSSHLGIINAKSFENCEQIVSPSNFGMKKTLVSSSTATNLFEKGPVTSKIEDLELNEFYDEVVREMEDILLDSVDSPGTRLAMGNRLHGSQFSMPLRDGGLTASTSSTDDAYLLVQRPARIDRIEVIGARQKKGDVSFSERLVGVKEYTVYRIKVWSSKDQWEVERRYRDFLTLYRCMKTLFTEQGSVLPLPWSSVEKESKIFRSASPDIIAKRSVLIQECLQSILHTRFFSSPPRALIWFLSPQDSEPTSPVSNTPVSQTSFTRGENMRNFSTLGKTISLIVEIPANKPLEQLLEAQHYTCAGCHKHFDDGKTLIWDFVQTLGWGKPRLCEYTGQLFCSSCHTNDTAVLPARVLHHWDFTYYPVSQLAKSYLDSIHEQPMLCVTAVNPFLLSKVPALLHIMSIRKKIGTMLPYVRCPFRRSINRALGNRRYLLESNDFFALRDLIDLSKGVFAALPVMVESVSRKFLEHMTDQCLICCDVGVPCSARQDCSDPSSLIFPFQEDDIERCKACQSVFHKRCFRNIAGCPCGAHLRLNETRSLISRTSLMGDGETRGTFDLLGRGLSSGLSSKFLTGLFSKEKPEKTREHKDENIILMGSLPSTSL